MKCPFCQSDNLELKQDTQCCEDCGGSFEVVQEPQDILLKDAKELEKRQLSYREYHYTGIKDVTKSLWYKYYQRGLTNSMVGLNQLMYCPNYTTLSPSDKGEQTYVFLNRRTSRLVLRKLDLKIKTLEGEQFIEGKQCYLFLGLFVTKEEDKTKESNIKLKNLAVFYIDLSKK